MHWTRPALVVLVAALFACAGKDETPTDDAGPNPETGETGEGTTAGQETGDSGATTSTTTSTTDGGNFVTVDAGSETCGSVCDIWSPGDCPMGEKCTAVSCDPVDTAWDSNVCRPINGDKQPGDECTYLGATLSSGEDDCGDGMLCMDLLDSGFGICREFCTGSAAAPVCGPDEICSITNDGTLPVCLTKCDPLSPACPIANNLCLPEPSGEGFVCWLDAGDGMSGYGTPCSYLNACNAGLLCTAAELTPAPECQAGGSPWCCTEVCDVMAPNMCAGMANGQECLPYYEVGSAPPGYETVGVCGVPTPREVLPPRSLPAPYTALSR